MLPRDIEPVAGFLEADERRRNQKADAAHLAALAEAHGVFALTAAGKRLLKCR